MGMNCRMQLPGEVIISGGGNPQIVRKSELTINNHNTQPLQAHYQTKTFPKGLYLSLRDITVRPPAPV